MVPGAEARGLVAPRRAGEKVVRGMRLVKAGKLTSAGLDSITTFPNHSADWSGTHVCYTLDVYVVREGIGVLHLMSPGKNGLVERSSSGSQISSVPNSPAFRVLTVLLEVLFAGGHELDSSELVSADV